MTLRNKILYSVLAFILIAQFIKPPKNKTADSETYFSTLQKELSISNDVHQLFKIACYDCHSNHSNYPWYNHITPVNWLVYKDIRGGKYQMNFSQLSTMSEQDYNHTLQEIIEEISEGKMPMNIYTITHRDAILSNNQKQRIINWAKDSKH